MNKEVPNHVGEYLNTLQNLYLDSLNTMYEQENYYKKKISELEENIEVKRKALEQANYWSKFKEIYGSVSLLTPDEKNKIVVESYERRIECLQGEIMDLRNTLRIRDLAIDIYDKDLEESCEEIDQLTKELEREKLKHASFYLNPSNSIIYNGKKYVEVSY